MPGRSADQLAVVSSDVKRFSVPSLQIRRRRSNRDGNFVRMLHVSTTPVDSLSSKLSSLSVPKGEQPCAEAMKVRVESYSLTAPIGFAGGYALLLRLHRSALDW